uniref:Putative methyltransferase n=1 Tax=viral metagenome TaxID=1070528 RepID=A0A6M3MJ80_9ZZZZ
MAAQVCIMTHESRSHFWPYLTSVFSEDSPMFVDHGEMSGQGCRKNFMRTLAGSLLMPPREWVIVGQDDIVLAPNLGQHFMQIVGDAPRDAAAVSFFSKCPGIRGIHSDTTYAACGHRWRRRFKHENFHILLFAIRRTLIRDLVGYLEDHQIPSADVPMTNWLNYRGHTAYIHVPSLVDHARGESIVGHKPNDGDRCSVTFSPDFDAALLTFEQEWRGAPDWSDYWAHPQVDLKQHVYDEIGEIVSRHNGGRPPTVLDLGCGTGGLLVALRHRMARANLIGIDSSAQAIDRAASLKLNIVLGDAQNIWLMGDADVIVCSDALDCFDDWQAVVASWPSMLCPGGLAIISLCPAEKRLYPRRRRLSVEEVERKLVEVGFCHQTTTKVAVTGGNKRFVIAAEKTGGSGGQRMG